MKYMIITAGMFLSLSLAAQTRVMKKSAVKANNYGITYSLPQTSLVITAEVVKVTCKAGSYYTYAEKYLNVKNAIAEDKVYYELGKVTLVNEGVPDPEQTYLIEFRSGTVAPFAYLTEDGLLCSINTEPDALPKSALAVSNSQGAVAPEPDHSVFSEELLMAGSLARQAEVAAKQIYRIRESRLNILTGEADNIPPDGEAMKIVIEQLEKQEKALTSLFTGICTQTQEQYSVTLIPQENIEKEVLFRFSSRLGVVEADNLGGAPVFISLKAPKSPENIDPKELEKKLKNRKGVIYNIPAKTAVEICLNQKTLYKGEVQVVQFGTQEGLAPALFEDRRAPVSVRFYPETGALKSVNNE